MSSTNNTRERDSYWKSPLLKKGEYDVWASEMQTHIMVVDGEYWKLIMKGLHKLEATDRSLYPLKIIQRLTTRKRRKRTRLSS